VLVVRLPETLDLVRVLASGGVLTAVVYQCGQAVLEWRRGKNRVAEIRATGAAEVAKIEATSAAKIAELQAIGAMQLALARDQLEHPQGQLDRPHVV
jgi:hypothetical protein